MERKRLIKPITVIKTRKFITEVIDNIENERTFSLIDLSRKHAIGNSNGSAMIRLGWIKHEDIRGRYSFGENEFISNESCAKRLIEEVRTHTATQSPFTFTLAGTGPMNINSDDPLFENHSKLLRSPKNKRDSKEVDLFNSLQEKNDHIIQLAAGISGAIWSIENVQGTNVGEINELITFVTYDLYDKLINYKP